MRFTPMVFALVLTGAVFVSSATTAQAQVIVTPAPVVSYYYAPPVVAVPAPVPAVAVAPPVVSYYSAPPVVSYYAPPGVAYYAPPVVGYPATVSRGLFGRTIVRTPYYRFKY